METSGNIAIYRSDVISSELFWHGFPERHGGVSTGPRASLNLGFRWGDSEENVFANRRLVAEHAGFDYDDLTVTKHVHGTDVWTVGDPLPAPPEFDGMVSSTRGVVLGAFAADCVPMVLADESRKICAAAHSGWRGTVNGIAANMVKAMVKKGAEPKDIRVALGPCIGVCCFEVGDEVVDEFQAKLGSIDRMIVDGPKKKHIDLRRALRKQFLDVGCLPEHIDSTPPCTQCNPDRFFSYRRDGQAGGVHMGFIGLKK